MILVENEGAEAIKSYIDERMVDPRWARGLDPPRNSPTLDKVRVRRLCQSRFGEASSPQPTRSPRIPS